MHDELARRLVEEAGGQVVKSTGDGVLATFDGPGRGIRCAAVLRDELGNMACRCGRGGHIGEVEVRGNDVSAIAVHTARVMAAARAGKILASRTVRDLVAGPTVALEHRGTRPLKGVEGKWQLFAMAGRRPACLQHCVVLARGANWI